MIASSGDTLQLDEPLAFSKRRVTQADASDDLDTVQRAHIEAVLAGNGEFGFRVRCGFSSVDNPVTLVPNDFYLLPSFLKSWMRSPLRSQT